VGAPNLRPLGRPALPGRFLPIGLSVKSLLAGCCSVLRKQERLSSTPERSGDGERRGHWVLGATANRGCGFGRRARSRGEPLRPWNHAQQDPAGKRFPNPKIGLDRHTAPDTWPLRPAPCAFPIHGVLPRAESRPVRARGILAKRRHHERHRPPSPRVFTPDPVSRETIPRS
jgi:hypothetical protein